MIVSIQSRQKFSILGLFSNNLFSIYKEAVNDSLCLIMLFESSVEIKI